MTQYIIGEYIAEYFKILQYCNILFLKIKKYIIIISEDIAIILQYIAKCCMYTYDFSALKRNFRLKNNNTYKAYSKLISICANILRSV